MKIPEKVIVSAAVEARITAIKEVRYLCDEALDHDTGWVTFCELVKRRLETETAFIELAKSQPPNDKIQP
jgi:ferritin-like protein